MSFVVEFFGIPRVRAGVERVEVLSDRQSATFGEVLAAVAEQIPEFAEACMSARHLREGYIASVNGDHFVTEDSTLIRSEQPVLILSTDAGG